MSDIGIVELNRNIALDAKESGFDVFKHIPYMSLSDMWHNDNDLTKIFRILKILSLESTPIKGLEKTCVNFQTVVDFLVNKHFEGESVYRVRIALDDKDMKFSLVLLPDGEDEIPVIDKLRIPVSRKLHPDVRNKASYADVVAHELRIVFNRLRERIQMKQDEQQENKIVVEKQPLVRLDHESDFSWNYRNIANDLEQYHGPVSDLIGVTYLPHATSVEEDEMLSKILLKNTGILKAKSRRRYENSLSLFVGKDAFVQILRQQLLTWRKFEKILFIHVRRWKNFLVFNVQHHADWGCVATVTAPAEKAWTLLPVKDEFDLEFFTDNAGGGARYQHLDVGYEEISDLFESLARHVFFNFCAKDFDHSFRILNADVGRTDGREISQ